MTTDAVGVIAQSLGPVGLLAVVVWLLVREQRKDDRQGKKDAADVGEQADKHVLSLLREHREERQEMRQEMNQLRERVAVMEAHERQHADVLQVHAAWDYDMKEQLRRYDPSLVLTDAPPLYPPYHPRT